MDEARFAKMNVKVRVTMMHIHHELLPASNRTPNTGIAESLSPFLTQRIVVSSELSWQALKELCKKQKLSQTGKKADHVQRLCEAARAARASGNKVVCEAKIEVEEKEKEKEEVKEEEVVVEEEVVEEESNVSSSKRERCGSSSNSSNVRERGRTYMTSSARESCKGCQGKKRATHTCGKGMAEMTDDALSMKGSKNSNVPSMNDFDFPEEEEEEEEEEEYKASSSKSLHSKSPANKRGSPAKKEGSVVKKKAPSAKKQVSPLRKQVRASTMTRSSPRKQVESDGGDDEDESKSMSGEEEEEEEEAKPVKVMRWVTT